MVAETDPRILQASQPNGNAPEPANRYDAFAAAADAQREVAEQEERVERGELPRSSGPRIMRLVRWCDVPEYEGFQYKAYLNFPQRLLLDVQSGDAERSKAALKKIILEHNGWCDEEGNPFPPATDDAFWDEIPTHLAIRVVRGINEQIREAPLAPPRRNS